MRKIDPYKIRAVNDFFICEELVDNDNEQETESGIIISRDTSNKEFIGVWCRVLSIGEKAETNAKKGDVVLFNRYNSVPFMVSGQTYHAIKLEYVIAKK